MANQNIKKVVELLEEATKEMAIWIAAVEEYQPTRSEDFIAQAGFRQNSAKVEEPLNKALAKLRTELLTSLRGG